MPLNTAMFAAGAVMLPNFGGGLTPTVIGAHQIYDPANARCTVATTAIPGSPHVRVTFTGDPAGDTLYLPYQPNEVHSMVLNGLPPGITGFVTANLSGCRFYIDQITGGGLVVYHANIQLTGGGVNPMLAATETPGQALQLDALVGTARAYYQGPPHTLTLTPAATLGSPVYRNCIIREMNRKQAQGRSNLQYLSGTTVAAMLVGGAWQFHWQTWADFSYDRPLMAPKRLTHGKHHATPTAQALQALRVLDSGRFF